ncbi:MAG: PAS domain S-box protein [Cyclobacteriaceae bacterium]|nr:PAS domain S-box protein [Cyclobacteriaceae bacterium]
MNEQFLSIALESSPGFIAFSLDQNYCYTSFTKSHLVTMKKIWGIDIGLGMSLSKLLQELNKTDYHKAVRNFDRALVGESFSEVEEYGDNLLARKIWENRYDPIRDNDGRIIGIVVISIEVSNQSNRLQSVEETNQRLALAVKAANIGIWEWNLLTNQAIWSDEILAIFNLTEPSQTFNYEQYLPYIHPEDVEQLQENINRSLQTGQDYSSEHRVIPPDGKEKWLSACGKILTEQGKPVKMIGTIVDITGRKRMEEEASQAYSLLQAAVNSTADGLLVVNTDGRISIYNNRFLAIFGFAEDEARNQPDEVLLSKAVSKIQEPEKFLARVRELYAKPHDESNDFMELTNGRILHRYSKPQILAGEVVGRVWSFRDITEQQRAEASLLKSEQLYRTLTDNMLEFINLVDIHGKIIYLSPSTKQILGENYLDHIGTSIFSLVHAEDLEGALGKFNQLIIEQKAVKAELRYLKESGGYIWLETNGNPIVNENGSVETIVLASREITERKRNEEKILEQNSKLSSIAETLKAKNEQLEEFTQIVSHNLRSPVSNILSLLDFYEKSDDEVEKKNFIRMLRESSSKMLSHLHELNEVLKIKQNKDIERQWIQFSDSLENVKQQLSVLITSTQAVIVSDFTSAPQIHYPNIYLESILINLLSNALKYRHPDKTPEIHFLTSETEGGIQMTIRDNGLGINLKKYGHHLFKLRKTFHNHPESRGIGLFMIKNQIEALGGEINIFSEENNGTTFTVKFGK